MQLFVSFQIGHRGDNLALVCSAVLIGCSSFGGLIASQTNFTFLSSCVVFAFFLNRLVHLIELILTDYDLVLLLTKYYLLRGVIRDILLTLFRGLLFRNISALVWDSNRHCVWLQLLLLPSFSISDANIDTNDQGDSNNDSKANKYDCGGIIFTLYNLFFNLYRFLFIFFFLLQLCLRRASLKLIVNVLVLSRSEI